MSLRVRLLVRRWPWVHETGTRLLDTINEMHYRHADRRHRFSDHIRNLRGAYEGQRCFVVGNGPSLKSEDLDLIKGEISFASNLIFEFFGQTSWRPTYYFAQDVHSKRLRDYVEQKGTSGTFVGGYFFRKHKIRNKEVVAFLGRKSRRSAKFSDDCSDAVGEMATVTFSMLQFAVYFGFKTIYLIGIDNTYRNVIDDEGEVTINGAVEDHFYPSASKNLSPANVGQMTRAYEIAMDAAASRGVQIVNATRGGLLEVYPRVALEDVARPPI